MRTYKDNKNKTLLSSLHKLQFTSEHTDNVVQIAGRTVSLNLCPMPQTCVLSNIVHLLSDTMIFDLVTHNSSLLSCQVNVSAHPGFVMSILHNGEKIHTVKSGCWEWACNLAAHLPVMLSVTISLTLGGKYKCQMHLMQYLITEKVSTYILPGNNTTSHNCSCRHVATIHQFYG